MWNRDVGALPVLDEFGRPVAMVTDRDVCMGAFLTRRALSQIRVSDVMSKQIYTVRLMDPISRAKHLMAECQVRRLPVVDDEARLVGIVCQNDIVREAARELEGRADISPSDVMKTVSAIGRHRNGPLSRPIR
jgi:CBS domain-containing protein